MPWNAIIVGAGPCGATAAIELARRGVRDVLLVDRDRYPRDKTCASGLSPNAIALLGDLGLGDELAAGAYSIDGACIGTPGGRVLHFHTPGAAKVLRRRELDQLLVDRAVALGVTFRDGTKVTGLLREGERVRGVRAGDEELRAGLVLVADGAHSAFSIDPRPKRVISTIMGWWEEFPFEPHTVEMYFDRALSPLYGWLFPEGPGRVNIGVCLDGDMASRRDGRNIRDHFDAFVERHFRDRMRGARQVGKLRGHPISWTTWIDHCDAPGVLFSGEAARLTHNASGEGIFQAMQSGLYAAGAIADVALGIASEDAARRAYRARLRRRFTPYFAAGHLLRGLLRSPLPDALAALRDVPSVRRLATRLVASSLAGTDLAEGRQPGAD